MKLKFVEGKIGFFPEDELEYNSIMRVYNLMNGAEKKVATPPPMNGEAPIQRRRKKYACDKEGCGKTFLGLHAIRTHIAWHEGRSRWKGLVKVAQLPTNNFAENNLSNLN